MCELQNQRLPFKNIGSREVTEKIKRVTRARNFKSLSEAPDRELLEAGVNEVMAIKDGGKTFLVSKHSLQAAALTDLVDMDSVLSLNEIQQIPGKKLATGFNGSTITVDEGDVKVVGRVVLVMERV